MNLSYECFRLIHVEMNLLRLNFNDVTVSDKSLSHRIGSEQGGGHFLDLKPSFLDIIITFLLV